MPYDAVPIYTCHTTHTRAHMHTHTNNIENESWGLRIKHGRDDFCIFEESRQMTELVKSQGPWQEQAMDRA